MNDNKRQIAMNVFFVAIVVGLCVLLYRQVSAKVDGELLVDDRVDNVEVGIFDEKLKSKVSAIMASSTILTTLEATKIGFQEYNTKEITDRLDVIITLLVNLNENN